MHLKGNPHTKSFNGGRNAANDQMDRRFMRGEVGGGGGIAVFLLFDCPRSAGVA